jgi:CHAT domain-containing protein
LHLVPVDALPLDEVELVGDRWQIELRSTLTELFENARRSGADGAFVGFGDVAYQPAESAESAPVDIRSASEAGALRGGVWEHGFAPLAATGAEVRGIAGCYSTQFGEQAEMDVLDKATATTERLVELAPRARWLHIATHGWFAPDTISSWTDRTDLDERSPGVARSASSKHGMSPMLLCGLAFAGANAPVDSLGQMPGLLTADELSTLDLSSCELAVLSACDTNVGERRAGQGVASLQRALQMAGARSAITSLWKVPDEATKELMVDFYRRLWVEKKPKWQALWEAKKALREMKDEHGAPKYTTRDWAAWVLTGAPD